MSGSIDAILHVVRTFEDVDTIHVDGQVDPVADAEAINLELIWHFQLPDIARRHLPQAASSLPEAERAVLASAGLAVSA